MRNVVNRYTYLERKIIYGPVESRRLGLSIGINLFPGEDKVCSLDCVYCFFPKHSSGILKKIIKPTDVVNALDDFFNSNQHLWDTEKDIFITFSGNGEPTLHPKFPEIVKDVIEWKNLNLPQGKLAVFSNSTQINRPEIMESLLLIDKTFLKLDWGTQEELEKMSRPIQAVSLQEIVDNLKIFVQKAKEQKSTKEVIIQTALYMNGRSLENWNKWAAFIKDISPIETNLYELDWPGIDYSPDDYFDFHALRRDLNELLKDEPINLRFIFSAPFSVNVDLCYAVDSLIYLPLYIAEYAKLFEKHEVHMNHFVSIDGDPGAVRAITSGMAEFAICDPFAAIDILADKNLECDPRYEPVLVAILIDRLALWCVSNTQEPTLPRNAILSSKKIITYEHGSTANYVWNWQLCRLSENTRPEEVQGVTPGEEYSLFCENSTNVPISVIGADLLGAHWCKNKCREQKISIIPYSSTSFGQKFMFTGLLASRDVIKRYPGAVDGVIKALLNAVEKVNDKRFINNHMRHFCEFMKRILQRKCPVYLQKWPEQGNELMIAISHAIHELRKLKIYSKDGRLRLSSFYRALMVRGIRSNYRGLPLNKLAYWVGRPAAGYPMRFFICLTDIIYWLAICKPLTQAIIAISLLVLTAVSIWFRQLKLLGVQIPWDIMVLIGGNLTAIVILSLYTSLKTWRSKEL